MSVVGLNMKAGIALAVGFLAAAPVLAGDWSGFYLGVNGGIASNSTSYDHVETFGVGGPERNREAFSTDDSSAAGGFQAGYQQQFGDVVLGVEGFYTLLDSEGSGRTNLNDFPRTRESRLTDYWGGAARIGYSIDNILPYVKLGYAGSTLDYTNTALGSGVVVGSSSERVGGVVLGAGVDFAVTENWTVGADYSFTKFDVGSQQQTRDGVPVSAFNDDNDAKLHLVTIRLNYKF
jgi:outer membrane immunogenic protein